MLTWTWEIYDSYLSILIDKIMKYNSNVWKAKIKDIYGIPRGGSILANRISYYTNIPVIQHKEYIDFETLLVDDILDSGNTIKQFMTQLYFLPKIACLVLNKSSSYTPDVYSFYNYNNEWIRFPYEPMSGDTLSKVQQREDK